LRVLNLWIQGVPKDEQKMIEMVAIAGAIMLLSMVKKAQKPLFGQLTLTGELALDWVKKDEVNEISATKIWFCNVKSLVNDWNVPEWAIEKGIVALIFPNSQWGNPLFITQQSILKVLEFNCATWESEGAMCSLIGTKLQGQITEIRFAENHPVIKMWKEKDARQFDPYVVEINGVIQE
jgi:hypothetical protein